MKKIILTFSLFSFGFSIGSGFLSIPYSAESLARGDHPLNAAFTTINPAGVQSADRGPSLNMSYGSWLADSRQMTVAYTTQKFGGSLSTKGRYVGLSGMEYRTETPTDDPIARFSSYGASFEVHYARILGKMKAGIGIKTVLMELYTAGTRGFALDAGLLLPVNDGLDVGLAVLNLGSFSSWGQNVPSFPVRIVGGSGITFNSLPLHPRLLTSLEWTSQTKGLIFRIGDEITWKQLILRSGVKYSREVLSFSGGFGIQLGIYSINYGFQLGSQDLGIPHLIDISIQLPK
ncbi:MAG: hypothetical protein GWO85_01525 [Simkaniaceae bacterium]|nr:hypothetical protein [Simkaniaceae bacterium]